MPITAISRVALDRLRGAGAPVRVHSRFGSGVNLALGGVLAFVGPQAAAGACGVEVSQGDLSVLAAADTWTWRGDAFVHAGLPPIALSPTAQVYVPHVTAVSTIAADAADRLDGVRRDAGGHSWFDAGVGARVGMPRLRAAVAGLAAMPPDVPAVLASVGLGVGLTPSGDDALVGALCVLSAFGARPALPVSVLLGDPSGGARTTDVSASYLRLAADGVFSPSLVAVVAALGEGPTALHDAVADELRFGATSGADALVGIREACTRVVATGAPATEASRDRLP